MDKVNVIVHEKPVLGITLRDSVMYPEVQYQSLYKDFTLRILEESTTSTPDFILGGTDSSKDSISVPFTVLADEIQLWDLKRRMLAYEWAKSIPLPTRQALFEAWYILKFLCQELSNEEARPLGREMAALKTPVAAEAIESFRYRILSILTKPSTPSKIRGSLWKNYTNQLKKNRHPLTEIRDPQWGPSESTLVYELTLLETEALKQNIFFGTSPVLYQELNPQREQKI